MPQWPVQAHQELCLPKKEGLSLFYPSLTQGEFQRLEAYPKLWMNLWAPGSRCQVRDSTLSTHVPLSFLEWKPPCKLHCIHHYRSHSKPQSQWITSLGKGFLDVAETINMRTHLCLHVIMSFILLALIWDWAEMIMYVCHDLNVKHLPWAHVLNTCSSWWHYFGSFVTSREGILIVVWGWWW